MSIIGSAVEKGLGILPIIEKIKHADPLRQFDFSIQEATNPGFSTIQQKEPDATKFFVLPFKINSSDYLSFLLLLQNLGFDNFVMLSMPHGEKLSPVHSNIAGLRQQLQENPIPTNKRSRLRNKFPSLNIFKSGRFHLRLFEFGDNTVIAAHIDQPNIDHLDIKKHLANKFVSDYPAGEDLFNKLLQATKSALEVENHIILTADR